MRQFPHGIIARYAAEVKAEVKVLPSNFPAEFGGWTGTIGVGGQIKEVQSGQSKRSMLMRQPQKDYITAYARAYTDSQRWHRPYRDGVGPKHHLTLVVTGCAFNDLARAGYRDGWLDGKAAQIV